MFRRAHMLHLPRAHSKQYLSLATLVIESAALYSMFAIVFLVSYAVNNPINQLWLGVMQAAQVRHHTLSIREVYVLMHSLYD